MATTSPRRTVRSIPWSTSVPPNALRTPRSASMSPVCTVAYPLSMPNDASRFSPIPCSQVSTVENSR